MKRTCGIQSGWLLKKQVGVQPQKYEISRPPGKHLHVKTPDNCLVAHVFMEKDL